MKLKDFLTEDIDPGVKKIKKGDYVEFFVGKGKNASHTLYSGKVKKVTKDAIYITTKMMYDYESLRFSKHEIVLPED